MIEEKIKAAPGYRLVARGETPEETVQNLCDGSAMVTEIILTLDDQGRCDLAEKFLQVMVSQTGEVMKEIFEHLGLDGGVADVPLSELGHLSHDEAKDVFEITATMHELCLMAQDVKAHKETLPDMA